MLSRKCVRRVVRLWRRLNPLWRSRRTAAHGGWNSGRRERSSRPVPTDPFSMLMLIENLGEDYIVWDKSAGIRFKKPGSGTVSGRIRLFEKQVRESSRLRSRKIRSSARSPSTSRTNPGASSPKLRSCENEHNSGFHVNLLADLSFAHAFSWAEALRTRNGSG